MRFEPYQVLHEGHRAAPEADRGEEDDDERRGDEDAADVVVELEVEAQRVGDGPAQPGEPHDQHHFLEEQSWCCAYLESEFQPAAKGGCSGQNPDFARWWWEV